MCSVIAWSSLNAYVWKKHIIFLPPSKREGNLLILLKDFSSKDSQEQNDDTQ